METMNKPENPHAAGTLAGAVIDFVPMTALRPDPRNSRKHSEAQVSEIVASMGEFGWTIPILADMDDDGLIAAGHGRLMAAGQVYAAGGLIRWIDGTNIPVGHVPVIDCSGWTPDQRRKYVIADNRLAEKSEWDFDMLRIELEELELIDADDEVLRSIGFTADELDDFFPAVDPATFPSLSSATAVRRRIAAAFDAARLYPPPVRMAVSCATSVVVRVVMVGSPVSGLRWYRSQSAAIPSAMACPGSRPICV